MGRKVVATAPGKVAIQEMETSPPLPSGYIRVQTLFSLISEGTETKTIRGQTASFQCSWSEQLRLFTAGPAPSKTFPADLGYSCVGKVAELNACANGLKEGDLIWLDRPHRSEHAVPEAEAAAGLCKTEIDPRRYIFRVLAKVAFAGVHDAQPYLGSSVAVVGLGVIGQLCLDLLALNGATEIIGIDPNAFRRKHAAQSSMCCIDPFEEDPALAVKKATKYRGVDVAIETSGTYEGLVTAIRCVRVGGCVVTVSTYTQGASPLHLGQEYHRNRIEIISSMSVNNCPHRGYPLWDAERLKETAKAFLATGRICPERHITRSIALEDLPDFYEQTLNGHRDHVAVAVSY